MMRFTSFGFLVFAFGTTPAWAADEVPTLETALVHAATPILTNLRAKGIKTVGVLKFLGSDDQQTGTESLGTINSLITRRLEIALMVKNSADPKDNVIIIQDASAVAANQKGANHTKSGGRAVLFDMMYTPAWGKGSVKADAFLFGDFKIEAGKQTMLLTIALLSRNGSIDKVVDNKRCQLRPEHLVEASYSFKTRGAFDDREGHSAPSADQIVAAAAAVSTQKAPHPLQENDSPFVLEVLYDDKPQPIEYREGKAWLPEPNEQQLVTLRYRRRDVSERRFMVVIKVNGESVIQKRTGPDRLCGGYISDSRSHVHDIKGYQMSGNQYAPFKVASTVESRSLEFNYGDDVGTISMTIFAESLKHPPKPKTFEQMALSITQDARLPFTDRKDDYAAFQAGLYGATTSNTRGLINPAKQLSPNEVVFVAFDPDPTPLMSAVVHYYRRSP